MERPLRVAVVAASLRILGGHAVQARRMIDGWRGDPRVDAWLVPIDPLPPAPLAPLRRVKYVRTLLTQSSYWPLLVRELAGERGLTLIFTRTKRGAWRNTGWTPA